MLYDLSGQSRILLSFDEEQWDSSAYCRDNGCLEDFRTAENRKNDVIGELLPSNLNFFAVARNSFRTSTTLQLRIHVRRLIVESAFKFLSAALSKCPAGIS